MIGLLLALVRALVGAGATAEMVLAALEAVEASGYAVASADDAERVAARRAAAAERQRRSRAARRDASRAVTPCHTPSRVTERDGVSSGGREGSARYDDNVGKSTRYEAASAGVAGRDVTPCHALSRVTGRDAPPLDGPPLFPCPPNPLNPISPPLNPPPAALHGAGARGCEAAGGEAIGSDIGGGDDAAARPPAVGDGRRHWTRVELDEIERKCRAAFGVETHPSPGFLVLSPLLGLLDAGFRLEEDILPVLRAKRGLARVSSWAFFVAPVREAASRRAEAASGGRAERRPGEVAAVSPIDPRDFRAVMAAQGWRQEPDHFDKLCRAWFRDRRWPIERGPRPGEAGGFVPPEHVADWLRRNPDCVEAA